MLIREPILSDVPELNKLLNSVAREKIHLSVNKTKTLKEREKWFKKYLEKRKKNKKIMLVGLKNNKIVGFFSAKRKNGKKSHVWEISYQVKKEYRKIGIGSTLLSKLLDYLKNIGAEQIIAFVIETNKASATLLKKFGFEEVGRIKKGIKIGENYCDYILFQKTL